jgi:hypothetical protein
VVPRDLLTGANGAVQSEKLTVYLPNFFRGQDQTAETPTADPPNAKRQTLTPHPGRENGLEIGALRFPGYDANVGLNKFRFF